MSDDRVCFLTGCSARQLIVAAARLLELLFLAVVPLEAMVSRFIEELCGCPAQTTVSIMCGDTVSRFPAKRSGRKCAPLEALSHVMHSRLYSTRRKFKDCCHRSCLAA